MCGIQGRIALILTVAALARELPAQALPPDRNSKAGGSYQGRSIGFQPRHGRVYPARPIPPAPTQAATSADRVKRFAIQSTSTPESAAERSSVEGATIATTADDFSSPLEPMELAAEENESWYDAPFADDASIGDAYPLGADPVVWVRGEYLLWWTAGAEIPALATTSPGGTAQENAGVLGRSTTTVLIGGEKLLDEARSGGRGTLGFWLEPCHQSGIEFSYLGLGEQSEAFRGAVDDFAILARPFFNLDTGLPDSRLIAFPDLVEGAIAIEVSTEFQTAEVLMLRSRGSTRQARVDLYLGYRFAELEDGLMISEATTSLAAPTTGTHFQLDDRFESRNQFNGGQIGLRIAGHVFPRWSTEFVGKFGLGNNSSRMSITGQTTVTPTSGAASTQPVGLLVQRTNSGVFESDDFSTLSEFHLTLRRPLECGWSFHCGYQFLLWTDVLRAGDQIDPTINVTQIPPGTLTGAPRPAFPDKTTDFWAQGLSFGLEYCY